MKAGFMGTFVISWAQTEVDGLQAAPLDMLIVGASWRWTGDAVRVDAPQSPLMLDGAEGVIDVRRRAAKMVRHLIGAATAPPAGVVARDHGDPSQNDQSFVVTDGRRSYLAFNAGKAPITVRYSDGRQLQVPPGQLARAGTP